MYVWLYKYIFFVLLQLPLLLVYLLSRNMKVKNMYKPKNGVRKKNFFCILEDIRKRTKNLYERDIVPLRILTYPCSRESSAHKKKVYKYCEKEKKLNSTRWLYPLSFRVVLIFFTTYVLLLLLLLLHFFIFNSILFSFQQYLFAFCWLMLN